MTINVCHYDAVVEEEDGTFWAYLPDLSGCYSCGDTLDELKVNLREAITLHLEAP